MTSVPATTIGATTLGFPRIGRDRELKRALERYWGGRSDIADLRAVGEQVRRDGLETMRDVGLDSVPVGSFSYYDQVLDAALMVRAVPPRFADVPASGDDLDGVDAATFVAMARGTEDVAPLEMTKWFDTNYHYLVPEIGPATEFSLNPAKILAETAEAIELGISPRPMVVGPYTFLALAKAAAGPHDADPDASFTPLDRLDDLVEVYVDLLERLSRLGAPWVQLDEPALVLDLDADAVTRVRRAYERLSRATERPRLFVATYFDAPVEALPVLASTGVEAIGLDLTVDAARLDRLDVSGLSGTTVVLGLVDGRNVWRTDLRRALSLAVPFLGAAGSVAVSTSCSLLHVPYDVGRETGLDPELVRILAFADQKLDEVVALQLALDDGLDAVETQLAGSDEVVAARPRVPGLVSHDVQARLDRVTEAWRSRPSRVARRESQSRRLGLPTLPTTTIGSFPQTTQIRTARAERRAGQLDDDAYRARMRAEIDEVVALQEELGLDVLVHGEPERNDMVQYFAELLAGFATTDHGWVQSYGSRCVRPPILFGDVHRPEPMTVPWSVYAQGRTAKPVKAMLTGPVTILAWSFVRDDQPLSVTADQVALALRDEVHDLESSGLAIVQVDEPALRELLPLREAARGAYLAWSVAAFRLATAGVADSTQVHTHLCYSDFGAVIAAIDALDADVTSVEAARSQMELLPELAAVGFDGAVGPGVYDIHSPRVPSVAETERLLSAALAAVGPDRLWVNPDCGLKTRGYDEVVPSLQALVTAAKTVRETP